MENTIERHPKRRLGLLSVLILVLLASVASVIWQKVSAQAAADANRPMFSFTGATGWWQGATDKTSMSLFNYNKTSNSGGGQCYVSVDYKSGSINIDNELERTYNKLTSSKYTVTQIGTKQATIQSTSGNRQYVMHQSSVTSPADASQLMGGQEYGFVQLSGGYLYIVGLCNTPDQLPQTYPALTAMKFETTKK